ncbi:hypothetical protein BKA65DRAFT_544345 [Rhexocercosporidium sp. MPI-PUGE-AT-0058]|nr:hypothetical protein BKA65DRAFT_544345 [Rhexocercosporidium sp. MPI-PUGE-AT-0058]
MPSFVASDTRKLVVITDPNELTTTSKSLCINITKQLTWLGHVVTKSSLRSIVDLTGKISMSPLDIDAPLLSAFSRQDFDALKTLIVNSTGVLWITRGGHKNGPSLPEHSTMFGLFHTVGSETPHLRIFNLNLSLTSDLNSQQLGNLLVNAGDEGIIYVPRLVEDFVMNASLENTDTELYQMQSLFQPDRPLKLIIGEVGIRDTLVITERDEFERALPSYDVKVEIRYSALNFVDVMSLLGYISDDCLGAEFSGVVARIGTDVPKDKFHVSKVHWHLLLPVPEKVVAEAAAASHIVVATAYFALYENGRLKPDDTIQVHSAAGGLGQADIQLVQKIGAVIYCTVGSLEKKYLLMKNILNSRESYLQFPRHNICARHYERNKRQRSGHDFEFDIGEILRVTWNCLADFGVMVEVEKGDILLNNNLEMGPFIRGCTFTAVNLTQYTTADCEPHRLKFYLEVPQKVNDMLAKGGITSPYPLHMMSITQAEEVFQFLKSGKMADKLVLGMDSDAVVRSKPRKEKTLQLDSNATYLLAGGLGGIGRSLAELMVKHGAKHIAFFS